MWEERISWTVSCFMEKRAQGKIWDRFDSCSCSSTPPFDGSTWGMLCGWKWQNRRKPEMHSQAICMCVCARLSVKFLPLFFLVAFLPSSLPWVTREERKSLYNPLADKQLLFLPFFASMIIWAPLWCNHGKHSCAVFLRLLWTKIYYIFSNPLLLKAYSAEKITSRRLSSYQEYLHVYLCV